MNAAQDRRPDPDFFYLLRGNIMPDSQFRKPDQIFVHNRPQQPSLFLRNHYKYENTVLSIQDILTYVYARTGRNKCVFKGVGISRRDSGKRAKSGIGSAD